MIDPTGMTLTQYADAVILTAKTSWSLGRLDDEGRWQDWAVGLLRAVPFASQTPPDPYQFDEWGDWAMRVYPMLEVT